jgi:hypothetical protein
MMMTEEELSERRRRDLEYKRREKFLETEEQRKARLERKKEQIRKLQDKETPEELQERRKLNNERAKRKRLNETPEQRQRRLDIVRRSLQKMNQKMTPEQIEARRQKDRERNKTRTEEQRQRRNEMARLSYMRRKQNATSEQRAKTSDDSMDALDIRNSFNESNPRPGRSAKSKAGGNIRHQLEHETPEADLKNSDDSTDALDFRISNNQSDEKIYDSNAATDRTTKSNGKESEDCSMTLAEKWGLRPLVVRLERIDVAELVHKVKQEPAAIDDSAGVKVKRTKNPNGCVDAPSARITRWL